MRRIAAAAFTLFGLLAFLSHAADDPSSGRVYELRTYATAPGRLDNLVDRFREHNLRLFQKHGITLVGAWVPADKDDQGDRLVYLVSFPSREAASQAWAAFSADPEWKALFEKEKQTLGTVVSKVENVFLAPTDYSPSPEAAGSARTKAKAKGKGKAKANADNKSEVARKKPAAGPRIYELRTYIASEGRLDKLNKRFRDHTLEIFQRHGMTNIFYGVPLDADKGADNTLVYFLAFPDREAAKASWKAFGEDPEWQKVRKDSEADGVKLAAKVISVFLKPTTFSPLK